MSLTSNDVISKARRILRDTVTSSFRWSNTTLMGYLDDAQTEVAWRMLGTFTEYSIVKLTQGEVRHDILDVDVIHLLSVERNMGGLTSKAPGAFLTRMEINALLRENRSASLGPTGDIIDNWGFKPESPRVFYTSPAAGAASFVELSVVTKPPVLTDDEDLLDLLVIPDNYQHILQLFVQGWALMEDTPGSDFPRGEAFILQAYQALGLGVTTEEEEGRKRG